MAAPPTRLPGVRRPTMPGCQSRTRWCFVDRGACHFSEKQTIAAKLGAAALIIADNVDEERMGGTLGQDTDVTIPVVSISKADGARLRDAPR